MRSFETTVVALYDDCWNEGDIQLAMTHQVQASDQVFYWTQGQEDDPALKDWGVQI